MLLETRELVKSTREAFGDTLIELGKANENIFVMDADLSESTKTNKFAARFPERFLNMGISEQNMMGTAAGLALSGKIPIVSTFAVFATMRAGEQVRTSIAYPNLNVKIIVTHSGLSVGTAGATHFCEEDLAIMRSLPNMVVIAPADALETDLAVRAAVEYKGPVYIRLGRGEAPVIYKELDYEIGKAITLCEGKDVTIIATGIMVGRALEAARKLKTLNVEARVIDMHTIKPIDKEAILKAVEETKGIITLEDHNVIGGLGSAVAEVVAEEGKARVKRLGIPDVFCAIAKPDQLWDYYGMSVNNICDLALSLINSD
ncbi:transketolase family protein [Neomoorella thermoacetica]|uniref:transketolase family protein n=1 Tax=Neomoorella thermoacetica TaxID=1525 RepID=UPI0030D236C4